MATGRCAGLNVERLTLDAYHSTFAASSKQIRGIEFRLSALRVKRSMLEVEPATGVSRRSDFLPCESKEV